MKGRNPYEIQSTTLKRILPILFLTLCLVLPPAAAAAERESFPPPDGDREVELTAPRDLDGPVREGPKLTEEEYMRLLEDRRSRVNPELLKSFPLAANDDIGGDDVVIVMDDLFRNTSMDIASNGDIYLAVEKGEVAEPADIFIYRSQDGGDTWDPWGNFHSLVDQEFRDPSLVVAEGDENRCYIAYSYHDGSGGFEVRLAYSDLSSSSGTWYGRTVMSQAGIHYGDPRLVCDADVYSGYYLYIVGEGWDGAGTDIWFSRSTDQGDNWESPYMIAEMTLGDRTYWEPDIAFGYGGYIHVAWIFEYYDETVGDAALRYRRASGFATGGIAAWDAFEYIGSAFDAAWESNPRIEASPVGYDVLISSPQMEWLGGNSWNFLVDLMTISYDQGATFPDRFEMTGGMTYPTDLHYVPSTGGWILGGNSFGWYPSIQRASGTDPTTWTENELFVDEYGGVIWGGTYALDPSRDNRVAASWILKDDPPNEPVLFDAEWRADAGYPNFERGFPQLLDAPPVSAPALVDLDDNGDLEIVWGDIVGRIHAVHHSGAYVTGFPIVTGHFLSDGGVAIGRLKLTDELSLVVGTTNGEVFCYDVYGDLVEGWPWDTGTGVDAYVSIGATGGPYPRTIVVCSGENLDYRTWNGERPPGALWRTAPGRTYHAPCAIGDIDGDGVSEIVGGRGNQVFAVRMKEVTGVFGEYLASDISDAVTLGDLDYDGEKEIIVPTADGTLYALNEDGSAVPGSWPFVSSTGTALTSGAIAQCLGTTEPDVAVAARNWTVHLLLHNGDQHSNYPMNSTNLWYIYGAPLIGRVDGSSSDVVVGDRGEQAWAWSNVGVKVPGWPKGFDAIINVSPAMGDIDLDGNNEIVILSATELAIIDVNNIPNDPSRTWPMYGHDPQRTGCADCSEDLVSSVPIDGGNPTRLSFRAPNPNPRSGPTALRFDLPVRAAVNLEIIDLRGRRLRTVLKEERDMGPHVVEWDGRDRSGRTLAAGMYFARLQVRGPGLDETHVRKMIRLR